MFQGDHPGIFFKDRKERELIPAHWLNMIGSASQKSGINYQTLVGELLGDLFTKIHCYQSKDNPNICCNIEYLPEG